MTEVKLHFREKGGEIQKTTRFVVSNKYKTWNSIKQMAPRYFPVEQKEFVLQWTDDEGHCITIEDEDCFEAMAVFHKDTAWKMTVVPVEKTDSKRGALEHEKDVVHPNIRCKGCESEVRGSRYKCLECADYDLCMSCEDSGCHSNHSMIRIPSPAVWSPDTENMISRVQEELHIKDAKEES